MGSINGHSGPINSLTFTPQGQTIITASDYHKVKLWSGNLGRLLETISSKNKIAVTSVRFHPAGHLVASGYNEGQVKIVNVEGGGHQRIIICLAMNSSPDLIHFGGKGDILRKWNSPYY